MAYDISTAGSRVYISDSHIKAPDPHAIADDFDSVNWLYLGDAESLPTTSATADVEEREAVGSTVKKYQKGAIGFGNFTLSVSVDTENEAQIVANDALKRRCGDYAFRFDYGSDCGKEDTVTISKADPAEVTWAAHGLGDDTPISFTTGGELPAPLRPHKIYFVVNASTGTFELAERPGGDPIETTETGSGVHKAIAMPPNTIRMLFGFVSGVETDPSGVTLIENIQVQQTSYEVKV